MAVTDSSAFKVSVQVSLPLHAPPQFTKYEFGFAVVVSVTWVPAVNVAVQVLPQLIPDGVLLTVPLPLPANVIVSVAMVELNVAVIDVFAFIVTVHVPVPLHEAPDHPPNTEFVPGLAVSVTCVPAAKLTLQAVPQLIPAVELVTVPVPAPAGTTINENVPLALV